MPGSSDEKRKPPSAGGRSRGCSSSRSRRSDGVKVDSMGNPKCKIDGKRSVRSTDNLTGKPVVLDAEGICNVCDLAIDLILREG